jgi:hypothetical protein
MSCLLSLTPCHPDDVPGMHTTPDTSGVSEPPGRLPPVPGSHGKISGCSAFPREISDPSLRVSPRGPELSWASLLFRNSGQDPKHGDLSESSPATYCGMHATPVYYGKTVPPGRLPSCTGSPVVTSGIRNGQAVWLKLDEPT